MTPRKYKPDPDTLRSIIAFITAGTFPAIAAEAAGIPSEVFEQWLTRGNPLRRRCGWKAHPSLTPFWHQVNQATATARARAEIEALRDDPLRWLMQGPGKDSAATPGWSQMVRPVPAPPGREVNLLLDPQMQGIFATILQVLTPYPEARAAIAGALAGAGSPRAIEARPKDDTPR